MTVWECSVSIVKLTGLMYMLTGSRKLNFRSDSMTTRVSPTYQTHFFNPSNTKGISIGKIFAQCSRLFSKLLLNSRFTDVTLKRILHPDGNNISLFVVMVNIWVNKINDRQLTWVQICVVSSNIDEDILLNKPFWKVVAFVPCKYLKPVSESLLN